MTSIIVGVLVVIVSIFGLMVWWDKFILLMQGVLPVSFLLAGIIAIIAGVSGLLAKNYEKLETKNKKPNA